ncbi:MAG TPA: hypothetical protein PLN93_02315, partial [Vicinamibacterales bacterium]|nr:hypothetical protein [Vicinamibacterales bacterium]
DRAIALATATGREVPERWTESRSAIHAEVLERGWNADRNTFVSHYEGDHLDAGLLLMGTCGFIDPSDERFDAITSDPLDPWVKGAAMLYSREFFQLVRRRLNPGGIVTLFVQLYSSSEEAVKSEIATFFEAFPDGIVFGNTYNGAGYDLVLLGQAAPGPIDIDRIEARLRSPGFGRVAASLGEVGFGSAVSLLATYAGEAGDLRPWLAGAAINRDRNLRLQYLAGMGVNLRVGDAIYQRMLMHRALSSGRFGGSESSKAMLWQAIENPPYR